MFLESYLHKFSKEVLREWFIGDPLSQTKNTFKDFTYKENEFNNENILFEYAIVCNNEYNSINYSWSEMLGDGYETINPTYEELRERNINVIAVIDMVIMDNNKPKYFIEVKNTNPVSSIKLKKLKMLGLPNLYEFDCDYIMRQCGIPKILEYDKLI